MLAKVELATFIRLRGIAVGIVKQVQTDELLVLTVSRRIAILVLLKVASLEIEFQLEFSDTKDIMTTLLQIALLITLQCLGIEVILKKNRILIADKLLARVVNSEVNEGIL